jgi:hypothetical protein
MLIGDGIPLAENMAKLAVLGDAKISDIAD